MAERFLWWTLLCLTAWNLGISSWHLLAHSHPSARGVVMGTSIAALLALGAGRFAHVVDPGNETKIFRVLFPRAIGLVVVVLTAAILLRSLQPHILLRDDRLLASGCRPLMRERQQPYFVRFLFLAAASFCIAIAAYLLGKQLGWTGVLGPKWQLFLLLLMFVVPASLLEWGFRVAQPNNARIAWTARFLMFALMGVAAFGM